MEVHIVQKGDTLWKISRQYGISFEELKRVNAHLANPDYIVPGMKIFLPNERKSQQAPPKKQQAPVKKIEKMEERPVIEKQPVKPPSTPVEQQKPEPEKVPIPLPKPPTITTKPTEKKKVKPPEKQEQPKQPKPPVEKPLPKPERPKPPPQQEQIPPQQVPPMIPVQPYPIFGIPCGWMPIYDADCYGHHHYHKGQGGGRQHAPTRPMTQLPVEESSYHQTKFQPIHPAEPQTQPLPSLRDEQDVQIRRTPPQLMERPLPVPSFTPNIESPALPLPKVEQKEPSIPPISSKQPKEQPAQRVPYPNAPAPQQPDYPRQQGQWPGYGGPQFIPVVPPTVPVQSQAHPFCHQCNQPIGQHAQAPMYFPGFYPWQGPHS